MDEELEFHIDMETERIARESGVSVAEARRRARAGFGGVTQHKETLRNGRGLDWLGTLSLDFRLGVRMMRRTPGLTFVGLLGLSVAVAVAAFAFSAVGAVTQSALPFDEGDRIVAITNFDRNAAAAAPATHLTALAAWRTSLRAVDDLGAFRIREQNLITTNQQAMPVRIAEMSASGFRVTRVAPIRGRHFTEADEQPAAPRVVVIGYDLWQSQFSGRDDVIGSSIRFADGEAKVIGVMPKGYAFPVDDHLWAPLRLRAASYPPGKAPSITVFGRLAASASLDAAELQAKSIQHALETDNPESFKGIQPRVQLYARTAISADEAPDAALQMIRAAVALLLVVIGVNVAVLVYARTASRGGEIAVRTALGASRKRIVMQLFVEALVLSSIAAALGVGLAAAFFGPVEAMVRQSLDGGALPFWVHLRLTPGLALYVTALAVLGAVIIGVIPGLKATRSSVHANLQDLTANSSITLGRTWTWLLIAQVAVSVAALPAAVASSINSVQLAALDLGTPATASVVIATPVADPAVGERLVTRESRVAYANRVEEVARRLETERGYETILMSSPPGGESYMVVALDSVPPLEQGEVRAGTVQVQQVDADYFTAFAVHQLAGRAFAAADRSPGAVAVIVNRSFARRFLHDWSPLGRRMRQVSWNEQSYAKSASPTWEIVGVVEDFPRSVGDEQRPRLYLPLRAGESYPVTLAVSSIGTTPAVIGETIRKVALSVDPTLRVRETRRLNDILNDDLKARRVLILALMAVSLSVVLLSAAGVYALMSFTVVRRRREIGIRTALGAGAFRVLAGVLGRSARHVTIGISLGTIGIAVLARPLGLTGPLLELIGGALLVGLMTGVVALLATIGPARRALSVPPNEALRAQ